MLYGDYLDLEPRNLKARNLKPRNVKPVNLNARDQKFRDVRPRPRLVRFPVSSEVGKDCPAAAATPGADLSTQVPATAEPAPASSRAYSWTDIGSVLGNLLGGALFIGGMFLLPMVLRQLVSLL